MKQYSDRYFIDYLHEINSVDPLGWIDVIETMDAFMEMYDLSAMSKEYQEKRRFMINDPDAGIISMNCSQE